MNTQPEWPTWNLMGMMNNPWFRVRVHPTKTAEGELAVWFEHPTMPGPEGTNLALSHLMHVRKHTHKHKHT
jgi:hypothetical protein